MEGEKNVIGYWIWERDPTRRVLTILKPSSEVRSSPSSMLSVDVPNSSLVLGTLLSHGSTQCVQKNPQAEEIEHSEVNLADELKRSVVEADMSKTSKRPTLRARIQFFSLCWTLFLAGWSDASTGPLLPRIQSTYHVPCLSLTSVDPNAINK